ncbi:MAG: branched-chain amino acid ABC transporter substrate-binding protein [Rhodoferax sp.]|nr:branched-chain amino acid ABC transporter substrate-binding protein [Rhodoferax sp.]
MNRWLRHVGWRCCGAVVLVLTPALAWAATAHSLTVAVLTLSAGPRYQPRQLERAYPGHPGGPVLDAVRLAAEDVALALQDAGIEFKVREFPLVDAQSLPATLAALKAARVQHIVADLPASLVYPLAQQAPAALGGAIVLNVGADDDDLRNARCAPALLHTYPSRAMFSDALAQYLAARNWRKLLLLQGPNPADALYAAALQQSARRYGLKIMQTRPFKLSGDPRERDLYNTRLLTGDREHEVVVVADTHGEFARLLPYATQWPRPVAGSNGLMAMAWHPQWERYGGPQLSRRFKKQSGRAMQGQDWAAWAAMKALASMLAEQPRATIAQQLAGLRRSEVVVDGYKGTRLSFRAWDGQLRQPLMLGHGDGIVGLAPLEGALHPTEVLDTLGTDEKESACRAPT